VYIRLSPSGESSRHWPDGRGLSVASVTRFNGRRGETVLLAVQTPIDAEEEGLSVVGRRIFLLLERKKAQANLGDGRALTKRSRHPYGAVCAAVRRFSIAGPRTCARRRRPPHTD